MDTQWSYQPKLSASSAEGYHSGTLKSAPEVTKKQSNGASECTCPITGIIGDRSLRPKNRQPYEGLPLSDSSWCLRPAEPEEFLLDSGNYEEVRFCFARRDKVYIFLKLIHARCEPYRKYKLLRGGECILALHHLSRRDGQLTL